MNVRHAPFSFTRFQCILQFKKKYEDIKPGVSGRDWCGVGKQEQRVAETGEEIPIGNSNESLESVNMYACVCMRT